MTELNETMQSLTQTGKMKRVTCHSCHTRTHAHEYTHAHTHTHTVNRAHIYLYAYT